MLRRRGRALALAASFAAVALAASTSVTVGSASNAKLNEQIVVNSQGRTLYTLSGETASHLKCKTRECFKFWPPLTVPSRKTKLKAGLRRDRARSGSCAAATACSRSRFAGCRVYRYFKDHAKGETNGQGVESFGGTWQRWPPAANQSHHTAARENAAAFDHTRTDARHLDPGDNHAGRLAPDDANRPEHADHRVAPLQLLARRPEGVQPGRVEWPDSPNRWRI